MTGKKPVVSDTFTSYHQNVSQGCAFSHCDYELMLKACPLPKRVCEIKLENWRVIAGFMGP